MRRDKRGIPGQCGCVVTGSRTEMLIAEAEGAQHALQESEQRYKRLLASVTDYVYSVAIQDGRVVETHYGPGCEAVTGYVSEEFQLDPHLWYRMIEEADRAAVVEQAERILRGEAPPPLEHRVRHKSGSIRWIRNTAVPRRDRQGRLTAYDGLVSDITERKRAELALRDNQERLALVISGTNDGIWDWDITTGELYFSPRWKSMLGFEDEEIAHHFSSWEQLLHPDDRQRSLALLEDYLAGRINTYELEHRLRHKDGTYRWILTRGVALRDPTGKPIRMAGSHVDLTERKRADEQLLRAEIRAAKFESIGTLAAGVAHEVKNPLQTIVLGLDYLDHDLEGMNANVRQVLRDMRDAATRANAISRELLVLSSERGFETQPEDWNALIEGSLWLVNFELAASGIKVVRELAPDLPPLSVNRQKIQQVLVNLIMNSLQAMDHDGTLTLTTRLVQAGRDLPLHHSALRDFKHGEQVVMTQIHDDGPGIAPEHLPRIFDPFFTTKPVGKGTGLGLALVKKIVDLHRGVIDIQNAPGGGTLVTLVLRAEPENKS